MKKNFLFIPALMLFLVSCNSVDENPDKSITAADFYIAANENMRSGETLGTVSASTQYGALLFELTSQTPANSIRIDSFTGNITVWDESQFDFEINPVITGTVNICNGYECADISILITITDVDEFNKFVSFLPYGYNGFELFTVYTQNNETDEYLGFKIAHEYNSNEIVYNNQFRIIGAEFYLFDGEVMAPTGNLALTAGESESVYMRSGRDDFSGGIHGDEQLIDISFYVDGIKLNPSDMATGFALMPCNEFKYIQNSTIHETAIGGAAIPNHPVEAIRRKETSIINMGYACSVSYTWQQNISDFSSFYMSLSSIDKFIGDFGENEDGTIVEFVEDGGMKLQSPGNWMKQFSNTRGTSVLIDAYSSINDDTAVQKIWDIINYHKYYRDINPQRSLTANIGDVWQGETTVRFFKQ